MNATATAVAYLRVSTADQASDGVSLQMQEAKARAWALLNDYALTAVFVDAGVSGKAAGNREGLQAALAACKRGGVLVVYSLSRLARSTSDTLEIADRLQRSGVDLVSLSERIDTTSAAGKMIFRMLAVLAEFERDQVSERTVAAMQHKKALGELVGSVPFGYALGADGVHLEEDAREQAVMSEVRALRAGGLSMQRIADELGKRGYAPRGKRWHAQTISNILKQGA